MNVSRLTFTKETKEKMNKPLSHFEKGKLRWERLRELEEDGSLKKARNRKELSSMLGLGYGYGAGYGWITNMIKRGHIKETMLKVDGYNQPECEYSIIGQPDYQPYGNAAKRAKRKSTKVKPVKATKPTVKQSSPETQTTTPKVAIRYKDLTIELEQVDYTFLENLIKSIVK